MQDSSHRAADSTEAKVLTRSLQKPVSPTPLSDEVKAFIVRRLATFETPSQVVAAVGVNFGIELTRQRVYGYDPQCGKPPARRWRELHAATRAKFLTELAGIAVAHKTYRLHALDRLAQRAMDDCYSTRTAKLLKQAAMECGGMFERSRRKRT